VNQPSFQAGLTLPTDKWVLSSSLKEKDRSSNHNRMLPSKSMWLGAGWRNWYASSALAILSKDKIRNFLPAFEIKALDGGGLSVTLTSQPDDPNLAALQAQYWRKLAWQNWRL